jgi:hypothetical protein
MRAILSTLVTLLVLCGCHNVRHHPLQDGSIHDWFVVGTATYEIDANEIYGHGNERRNSFLVSPCAYGNFELEVDVLIDPGGNSGIQIRSEVDTANARVVGYQCEIDPSDRAWTGGIYGEGDRGWLFSLENLPEARAAFVPSTWNHLKIVCQGDSIKTWVNGIACADYVDNAAGTGVIAFQVHSGASTVRWRDLTILELPAP